MVGEWAIPFAAVYLIYKCGHRCRGTMSASSTSMLLFPGLVMSFARSFASIVDVSDPVFRVMTLFWVNDR